MTAAEASAAENMREMILALAMTENVVAGLTQKLMKKVSDATIDVRTRGMVQSVAEARTPVVMAS